MIDDSIPIYFLRRPLFDSLNTEPIQGSPQTNGFQVPFSATLAFLEGGGGLALRPCGPLSLPLPLPAALLLLLTELLDDEEPPLEAEAYDDAAEAGDDVEEEAAALELAFDRRPSATRWVPACGREGR